MNWRKKRLEKKRNVNPNSRSEPITGVRFVVDQEHLLENSESAEFVFETLHPKVNFQGLLNRVGRVEGENALGFKNPDHGVLTGKSKYNIFL